MNVTEESKEAARQYILKFDSAWSAHIKDGLKKKAKGTREPTSLIYNYDEAMHEFMQPWLKEFNELLSKHGESFRAAFTYKALTPKPGESGAKKNVNLFYPAEMYNDVIYEAYMESWEEMFFARDEETGADLTSSEVAKATSKRRVPDLINNTIRCVE